MIWAVREALQIIGLVNQVILEKRYAALNFCFFCFKTKERGEEGLVLFQ